MIFGRIKSLVKALIALPILLILILFLRNFSCSDFSVMPEIKNIENVSIDEIREDSCKISVDVNVTNKNVFSLNLINLRLNLQKNKEILGKAIADGEIKLIADSTTTIPIQIIADTKKMFEVLSKENDTVKFDLIGILTVKSQIGNFDKKVEFPFEIDINELLQSSIFNDSNNSQLISITGAELLDITAESSKLAIYFKITNPYDFGLTILEYPAIVEINGQKAGEGNIIEKIEVPANTNETGQIMFKLNNFKSTTSLLSAIIKRKIEYETKGKIKIKLFKNEFNLPFSFKGNLL